MDGFLLLTEYLHLQHLTGNLTVVVASSIMETTVTEHAITAKRTNMLHHTFKHVSNFKWLLLKDSNLH